MFINSLKMLIKLKFLFLIFIICGVSTSQNNYERLEGALSDPISCPSKCSCLGEFIDCNGQHFIDVPVFPSWVKELELTSNKITNAGVEKDAVYLPNLITLKMDKNHLEKIPTLTGLVKLNFLSLAQNRITGIDKTALESMPNLKNLDLRKNNILLIESNSFPPKNILSKINLNSNAISALYEHSLDQLVHLTDLKLNSNKIQFLPKSVFNRLKSLKRLELNYNHLEDILELTFQNLTHLKILKLKYNKLTNIRDGLFHGLINLSNLELDHNQIASIHRVGFINPSNLITLSLQNNSIKTIENDEWEFCTKIVNLDLSHNFISVLQKTALEGLTELTDLNLQGNKISSIHEQTFNEVPSIEVLNLSNNEISSIIEDSTGSFGSLTKLKSFYLNKNDIKSINTNAFLGLDSLETLDLRDNNITSIKSNSFEKLLNLKSLKLNTISIICDCNLQWFYYWILNSRISDTDAVCGYPIWLRGKYLRELHSSNFTCNDSPIPRLIDEPRPQLAITNTNLTLMCQATSSSSSQISFHWKFDTIEMKRDLYTIEYPLSDNENVIVAITNLNLIDVSPKQAGKYQCIASNRYGSAYSQKFKILVGTVPVFRKTPSNVTVKAGALARLDCAATGEPTPQIAWQKDGGNGFPAAIERRMHVMPSDDAFFIINAKIQDQGVYTCTAENTAGIIKANATLIINESPSFVKPMENKEVLKGKSSVLECMASGSPKPILSWTKNGKPIEETERHFFAADEQLLIIVDTVPSDAGTYACEIRNDLGSDVAYMKLTVKRELLSKVISFDDIVGIVVITVVCCAVGTSIIWVVIIYQTKKRSNNQPKYNGTVADENLEILRLNDIIMEMVPTTTNPSTSINVNELSELNCSRSSSESCDNENFILPNIEEDQVSSKDSGTGDSARRSSNDDFVE